MLLDLGKAKHRLALLGEKDVEGLEVAVNNVVGVEECEARSNLERNACALLPRKGV